MRPLIVWGLVLTTVLAASTGGEVYAAMTSTNYEIRFDHLGSGGEDTSSSSSYQLRDSIGGIPSQGGSSTSYEVNSGFRSGIFDPGADFSLHIESRLSQVAATALAGDTVTVTDSSGFSVGDMISVNQNLGANQVTAVGTIESIAGDDITVDFFKDNGTTPVIDGSNDQVYRLEADNMLFGVLTDSRVNTGVIAWEVNNDTDGDYDIYMYETGDLDDGGGDIIPDVADGTVSAAVSEYGARSSNSALPLSTFDTQDTAITTTLAQVGTDGSGFKSRDFLMLKVAIDEEQEAGIYTHAIRFVYVGDY